MIYSIILITDNFPLFFCQYEEFGGHIIKEFKTKKNLFVFENNCYAKYAIIKFNIDTDFRKMAVYMDIHDWFH